MVWLLFLTKSSKARRMANWQREHSWVEQTLILLPVAHKGVLCKGYTGLYSLALLFRFDLLCCEGGLTGML